VDAQELAIFAAQTCDEYKAEDVVVLDMRGVTEVTDFFVLATISTQVQMKAAVEKIRKRGKQAERQFAVEGTDGWRWVLVDFYDTVIHMLTPEAREYYELETLWGDAPAVNWRGGSATGGEAAS
jgi:ribosome-associated protein